MQETINTTGKSFVKGAAILGIAGLITKVLGAAFRIPLGNMLSEESMGYYSPAYFIYTLLIVISTSGLPVAISRMVAERTVMGKEKDSHRVFTLSTWLMFWLGLVSFLILFIWAGPISELVKTPEAKYPMMAISPSLLMVPLLAAFCGYFQGHQTMGPTAATEVIEQAFRVVVGLVAAYLLFHSGTEILGMMGDSPKELADVKGAVGAISGATVGSLAGLVFIVLVYLKKRKGILARVQESEGRGESGSQILKQVLWIAVPITIGSAVMPIMNLIEVPIIKSQLTVIGMDADNLYGMLSGYVASLINLPQVLTSALAMSLVPMISAVFTQRDQTALKDNTVLGMRIAMMVGLPCAFGLAVLAKPIMLLLYPAKPQIADNAAACLMILGIGVIFLSIAQTLTAILQGVDKQMVPVLNLGIAIVVKIVLTYILVGIPALNIKGAALATTIAYGVAAVLDILAVKKYAKVHFAHGLCYFRPFLAAALMAVAALGSFKLFSIVLGESLKANAVATLLAISLAAVLYCILLVATKSLMRDDLIHLPKGQLLTRVYDKFVK